MWWFYLKKRVKVRRKIATLMSAFVLKAFSMGGFVVIFLVPMQPAFGGQERYAKLKHLEQTHWGIGAIPTPHDHPTNLAS